MRDEVFLSTINAITREEKLILPALGADQSPSSEFLADWAGFLELCVKKGLSLSDDRWQRLRVDVNVPHTRFALDPEGGSPDDPDFRVGLQLLMGMLEPGEGD